MDAEQIHTAECSRLFYPEADVLCCIQKKKVSQAGSTTGHARDLRECYRRGRACQCAPNTMTETTREARRGLPQSSRGEYETNLIMTFHLRQVQASCCTASFLARSYNQIPTEKTLGRHSPQHLLTQLALKRCCSKLQVLAVFQGHPVVLHSPPMGHPLDLVQRMISPTILRITS